MSGSPTTPLEITGFRRFYFRCNKKPFTDLDPDTWGGKCKIRSAKRRFRKTEQPQQNLVFTKTAGHKTFPGGINRVLRKYKILSSMSLRKRKVIEPDYYEILTAILLAY